MTRIAVALPRGTVTVTATIELPSALPGVPPGAPPAAAPAAPWAAVALAHGAGAGPDHPAFLALTAALRTAGVATMRFAFPYREAGRRMPGPAAHAVATWAAALPALAAAVPGVPVVAAGKSYGGRMASLAAAEGAIAPDALVYLGYPFHPPGEPQKTRGEHLARITAPQLFVEGTNDPFIQPLEDFEASVATCTDAEIIWVDGGGHSFEVAGARRSADEIGEMLAGLMEPWLRARL